MAPAPIPDKGANSHANESTENLPMFFRPLHRKIRPINAIPPLGTAYPMSAPCACIFGIESFLFLHLHTELTYNDFLRF
jgi:hypothetical protein